MPKIVDHKKRRTYLADVVLGVVSEAGINAVTMREVSKHAGWSTGVLNYYFSSRHELLLSALHRAAALQGRVFETIIQNETLDPIARLQVLVESVLPLDSRRIALTRVFLMFYAESMSSAAAHVEIQDYLRNWRSVIQQTVTDAKFTNHVHDLDPARLAVELVALSDGLAVHALLDPTVMNQLKNGIKLDVVNGGWILKANIE